jgi:DNA-binding CsgD family transcriptional regulator
MFRNTEVEKLPNGEYRVTFTTDTPSLQRFIKFFRYVANEADYFYHKVSMAIRSAELSKRESDPTRQETLRWEREMILKRYRELDGTPREKFHALRKALFAEGKPISFDSLHAVLRIAREEGLKGKRAKIEQLLDEGLPFSVIAKRLGESSASIIHLARAAGIYRDKAALEENLSINLLKLDQEGLSLQQISNQLGVPLAIVRRVARQAGIAQAINQSAKRKPYDFTPNPERAAQVAALAAEGLSFGEIGRRLRVNAAAVHYYAKRHGIPNPTMRRAAELSGEIAELAAKGLSSSWIAGRIGIPESVVRKHPAWEQHITRRRGSSPAGPGEVVNL